MIALIDGDILAWRCSASCEPNKEKLEREPCDLAIWRLDDLIYRILSETAADEYRIYLTGSENFRSIIYKDYKANRRGLPRPPWLDPCREFLVREWDAEVCSGYEADDGIAIHSNEQSVICTIDKDLNQIPGQHFNWVTKAHYSLDDREAARAFWGSVIQGDRSDNIRGLQGMGPVKADRALLGLSVEEMESRVRSYYEAAGREFDFVLNHRLLRLLRSYSEYHDVIQQINEGFFEKSESPELTEVGSVQDSSDVSGVNE